MNVEFVNRIWEPGIGARKGKKVLLCSLGGAILLLVLFQGCMDGFDKVNWMSGVVLPILLISIGMMGTRRGGYITASCRLTISETSIQVLYPAIDRQNKSGIHKEIYELLKSGVTEIQYSKSLCSFRLIGKGGLISEIGGSNMLRKTDVEEIILYPPSDQVIEIYNAIESILRIPVVQMDD